MRRLVLVAGPAAADSRTLAEVVGTLGFRVPGPRVDVEVADVPTGGEPRWVARFHGRLMREIGVRARSTDPASFHEVSAWEGCESALSQLEAWLARQFDKNPLVVVTSEALPWLLPLWGQVARRLEAELSSVIMLRHPFDCSSPDPSSTDEQTRVASRVANWVNVTLNLEAMTREHPRALVRTDELLGDWAQTVARLCRDLDLPLLDTATARQMRRANLAVGQRPRNSELDGWRSTAVHPLLADLAEGVWDHVLELHAVGDSERTWKQLDRDREMYGSLHDLSVSVAHSSILAAHRAGRAAERRKMQQQASSGRGVTLLRTVRRLIPHRWRQLVPVPLRTAAVRLVRRQADRR